MSAFKKLLKNKTLRNAGWLVGGKIAQIPINLLVSLLTARYLGPANYGLITYGTAYTAFFASLCNLGINSVLVKEFIDNPGEEGTIIGTSLLLRAVSSVLSAIMIFCIVSIVDIGEKTTITVVALCSLGLIFHIFETINFWFQSRLQSKVTAIATFIAYTATAAYKVVLLVMGKSVEYFAFSTSVDYICVAVVLLIAYKKHSGGAFHVSLEYGKALLKKSCHFILPGLMVAIYAQTDKIMLKQMIGVAENGYYSTAVAVSGMWCFVLTAIIDSAYPGIMSAFRQDERLFVKRNKQLYAVIFYLSLFVSLLFTLLAEPVIGILYGEKYAPAVMPLRIITWYTAFSYLGGARNAWIVCKERQKYLIHIYASSALLNVVLNWVLIPIWGASGAAVASLITQIATTMIVPFFIPELRENSILMVEAIRLKDIR